MGPCRQRAPAPARRGRPACGRARSSWGPAASARQRAPAPLARRGPSACGRARRSWGPAASAPPASLARRGGAVRFVGVRGAHGALPPARAPSSAHAAARGTEPLRRSWGPAAVARPAHARMRNTRRQPSQGARTSWGPASTRHKTKAPRPRAALSSSDRERRTRARGLFFWFVPVPVQKLLVTRPCASSFQCGTFNNERLASKRVVRSENSRTHGRSHEIDRTLIFFVFTFPILALRGLDFPCLAESRSSP